MRPSAQWPQHDLDGLAALGSARERSAMQAHPSAVQHAACSWAASGTKQPMHDRLLLKGVHAALMDMSNL